MAAKLYPAAKEQILAIWEYTERTWGEEQADRYVRGLVDAIHDAHGKRHLWRRVVDKRLTGIYFIRFQHHYLFFRELSCSSLGVISILHESQNIPSRLRQDAQKED
jgi:toxin ParE1/3/4